MDDLQTAVTSETAFLAQVLELAGIYGWESVHFRPAQTSRGWRTPVQGTMGKGWPDLTLVRARDRRLIFAELKADKGKTTAHQDHVLATLATLATTDVGPLNPRVEVYVWRPESFAGIARILA